MSFSKMNDTSILDINKVSSISMENIGKINNHVLNQEVSIQLVGLTSSYENGTYKSINVPKPSGVQVNDLIVLFFSSTSLPFPDPTNDGWTSWLSLNSYGSAPSHCIYYKIAEIDEPSQYTINKSYLIVYLMCLAFRNVNINSPLGNKSNAYSIDRNCTTWSSPSINIQNTKNWALYCCSTYNELDSLPVHNNPNSQDYTFVCNSTNIKQWIMYKEYDEAKATGNIYCSPGGSKKGEYRASLHEIIKA